MKLTRRRRYSVDDSAGRQCLFDSLLRVGVQVGAHLQRHFHDPSGHARESLRGPVYLAPSRRSPKEVPGLAAGTHRLEASVTPTVRGT